MSYHRLHRIIALAVGLVSLATYVITLPPSVVFWDVGEFMASAFSLQVPHPPGAPLFLLVAHVFSNIPFSSDLAVRMHMVSALSSAGTVMFLYLISVRFISMWRGRPATLYDALVVYGGSVIGALSLTFSRTFWFNAVEAEVYGLSMLFVSAVFWLGLRWYERADWERGDVYLLMIAYLIGLSIGVHLLAILALFSVMLIVYFRVYEFTMKGFMKFGIAAVLIFGVIYPGIVKWVPSLLDGEFMGKRSVIFELIPIVAILGAVYGVYRSIQRNDRIMNVALLSFLLIVLGYSTYTMVLIRANADPPMNENNPNTLERLISYLNREQYGTAPLLNRRWNVTEPEQVAAHQRYTSDWDYFWRFQLDHMYFRYFGWNFIGQEGDWKEAGVDWSKLFGIPFLLGLIGALHHWSKDWKMGFVGVTFFLIMGVVLVVYFNMQEPQPRERDYFYVGSFFVFAMWIGMGVVAIIDEIKERFFGSSNPLPAAVAILVVALVLSPVNMARANFHYQDRSGNYVPWDYSYNLLQSCEQDAILFTNGDNDTFPLWYLQDVEGVRRDIRIVNLSLLNTDWYIHQLKNLEPYGAKKVPISIPDNRLPGLGPIPWQAAVREIPLPRRVIDAYEVKDTSLTNPGAIRFTLAPTITMGQYELLRVQDILVFDILRTNNWERPIYFAMTVSDDSKIGLRDYMQLEGLAFRFVPRRGAYWQNLSPEKMQENFFTDIEAPSTTYQPGFLWRGLQDPSVYLDEDARRLMANYRQAFFSLGYYYANVAQKPGKFAEVLDRLEEVIPRSVIPMSMGMKFDIAQYYRMSGRSGMYDTLVTEIIAEAEPIVARREQRPVAQDNPYILLLQAYEALGRTEDALGVLDALLEVYRTEEGVDQFVAERRAVLQAQRADTTGRSDSPR